MLKTDELPQLAEFAAKVLKRRMGVIHDLWPSIRACLDAGHSVRAVHARLMAHRLEIPYSTLCWAIANLRKSGVGIERAIHDEHGPPKVEEVRKPGQAANDPLGNLHCVV